MARRTAALFISFILAVTFLFPALAVLATTNAAFSMRDVNNIGTKEEFSMGIYLDSPEKIGISGFNFSIEYDDDKLEYTDNSLRSDVFSGITSYASNGKINFIWESANDVNVLKGNIITVNFRATDSFVGSTEVRLNCISAYSCKEEGGRLSFINICQNGVIATATVSASASVNPKVTELIDKIYAIGTVVATEECRAKLDALLAEYSALSYSDKQKVTNYQVLVNAYNTYTELSGNSDSLNEEINKFLIDNSETLALRASTVTVGDRDKVAMALVDWEALSVSAKVKLTTERYLLKNLLSIIDELDAENQKQLEEEKLRKEAEQLVADFRQLNEWVLNLTDGEIMSSHRDGLKSTLDSLEEMEFFNDLAYSMLVKDGTLDRLKSLYKKANDLYIAEHPEDAEFIDKAENFKASFGYILSMTPDTLTYDDIVDVNLAYMVYSFLDDKTKGYLKNEADILETLMEAGESLTPDEEDDDVKNAETIIETKIVKDTKYVSKDLAHDYDLQFYMRGMSNIVWILLAIEGVALILLASVLTMYYFVRRKNTQKAGEEI